MERRRLTRKGNYILKYNLPIGVQNMTLKSIGTSIGERPLGRPRRRWKDNIKIELK